MKQFGLVLAIAALLLAATGGATASFGDKEREMIAKLQGEILVLQRQVRDLQESIDKTSGQAAASMQRVSENSETALRALSSIEEAVRSSQTVQNNNLAGASAKINRLAEQAALTDQRLAQILREIGGLKTALEQQQKQQKEAERQAAEAPRFDSPEQLYAAAYGLYTQGKYDAAVANFRRYLDAYGSTEQADNALFWIAESHFAQMKFEDALREYDRVITNYPAGDRVPAAYYKMGLTLLSLERREEGVSALRNLVALHPNAVEAAQARQELQRLGEPLAAPAAASPATAKPSKGRQRPTRN
jgi:tol-pal system protein YbgF